MRPRLFLECPKCGEFKHPDLFYSNVIACKSCVKKSNAARYAALKELHASGRTVVVIHKKCSKCDETKAAGEFSKSAGHPDGLCTWCRQCRSKTRRTSEGRSYTNRHRLTLKAARPKYYAARQMVIGARKRSKTKNTPFNITKEYILSILPDNCPVFGTPLDYGSSRTNPNSPTLDRFYPEDGYVIGNVFVISHKANTIKNNSSVDELLLVLQWMRRTTSSLVRSEAHGATSGVRRNSAAESKH